MLDHDGLPYGATITEGWDGQRLSQQGGPGWFMHIATGLPHRQAHAPIDRNRCELPALGALRRIDYHGATWRIRRPFNERTITQNCQFTNQKRLLMAQRVTVRGDPHR